MATVKSMRTGVFVTDCSPVKEGLKEADSTHPNYCPSSSKDKELTSAFDVVALNEYEVISDAE